MTSRRAISTALLTVMVSLGSVASASAGTATVYQCAGPAGQPAATDMLRPPDPNRVSFSDFCATGRSPWGLELRRGSSGNWNPGDVGELVVTGPAGTAIAGGQIERQMLNYTYKTLPPGATWGFGYRLSTAANAVIEQCGTAWDLAWFARACAPAPSGTWEFASTVAALPDSPTPFLRLGLGCYQSGQNCNPSSSWETLGIRRMTLRVADGEAPIVRSAVGALAGDQVVRSRTLSLNAADGGLGLYRLLVSVDGQFAEAQPFLPEAAACRDVNPSTPDPYEFASAAVCPTGSTSRSFSLASLPASGQHQVRVDVEDASGNRTVALDRVTTFELPVDGLRCPAAGCVSARPALNGTNASPQARVSATVKGLRQTRVAYGRRATLTGRVLDGAGAPIAGAAVDVLSQIRGSSARTPAGQTTTDVNGRFRYATPTGPSRTLRFEYRMHVGDPAPVAAAEFALQVRAGVSLTLRPAVVRPGGAVTVRGRLRGSGIPVGALVEVQALDGRDWRTFKTLTVRRGRFSYRYRFRHTSSGARFLWRVYARAQSALPYAAGASRSAWVVVR